MLGKATLSNKGRVHSVLESTNRTPKGADKILVQNCLPAISFIFFFKFSGERYRFCQNFIEPSALPQNALNHGIGPFADAHIYSGIL